MVWPQLISREGVHSRCAELLEELGDGCVHLLQVIESTVSESCEDPTLCHEYCGFNFSLVAWLSDTCWKDAGAEM